MAYNQVYAFTNENVRAFKDIYDFKDKKVLTVLGSGDQYLSALLYGAREVEVIDINTSAWYYFVFKITAIKYLTYEEFYYYFVVKELNDDEVFYKISTYLPKGVKEYFEFILRNKSKLSSILMNDIYFIKPNENEGNIIPYFKKDNYFKLQNILRSMPLPKFYIENIWYFDKEKGYDLMLLSNVFDYLHCSLEDYKKRIERFNCPEIMALYCYWMTLYKYWDAQDLGFQITKVPTSINNDSDNYVFTLRR